MIYTYILYYIDYGVFIMLLSYFRSLLGFMHMKINRFEGCFILGQFSKPFETVPKMIQFYQLNSLPIRGAERIHLVTPLEEELL